ncbi:M16 family metallopeptidase [Streptomyces halobius]|uniref:Insulinase family protein n=1 Tax=Streptomyces halobius TaxID=2879846 RepID=A0ABY4MAR4_9ACTN|nr:M16 family metallopeptidase [Streptomyces halobius]UQA94427.1 insulinase family protein [Streptomyces halobius]
MHKVTLRNGLRVVFERHPGSPRTAVCVHYGVGYRSEEPEREGFAHLFEHLMFRGSASLPPGRFFEHIHPLGGRSNGTTHQDYTDYHQLVPAAALERALFSEADRMRAPVFTEQTLAEQLDGIEEEIHQAVTARPYGGLPWPLLPGAVFDRFANAHDGYGRMDQLRTATVAACEEFFHTHYAPGNAVLTVVGDHDPDELLNLVERHFGDIPPRPFAPSPDLREPGLTEDRWQTCTEPAVTAAAIALGYRLPDPRTDITGYLAHAVLAEMISHDGLDGLQAVSAACGVFGMLDAKDPDLLVITALVPPMVPPRQAVGTMTERWAPWADAPDLARTQPQAVRRLITRHHREHADAYTRSRALGRLELLLGRAELLDEYPALLADVAPEQVADAARHMGTTAKGILIMAPGTTRTRPAPVRDAGSGQTAPGSAPAQTAAVAADPVTPPAASGGAAMSARPVPSLAVQPAPRHGPWCETTLAGGTRVVAVQDRRSPLVELRLRLPLGELGWQRPDEADVLVRLLAGRDGAAARTEAVGGSFHVATDGQWFDVTGYTTSGTVGPWLERLGELSTPVDGVLLPQTRPLWHRDPEVLMDTALRRHWLGGARPIAAPGDLGAVHRTILRSGGGWLVAVGALDPERFTADIERALSTWPSGQPTRPAAAAVGTVPPAGGLLALHHDASDEVHITLSSPEPAGDITAAARYLATAVVGTHYRSRMPAGPLGADLDHALYAARDICLGASRAYIRAALPEEGAAEGIVGVQEALRTFRTDPVSTAELEPMRTFCAAQLLGAFDSPAAKADLLRDCVSAGRPVDWAERLPDLLHQATADEVAAACGELFPVDAMTLVALGRSGPTTAVTEAWAPTARTTTPRPA